MSWLGRFANLFRQDRLDREIDEELSAHLAEAVERGRSGEEARRAFGGTLRYREQSRDLKLLPWLESLGKDAVFGWRQLNKHRSATAAAILSLALAIGAATAAFRLVDAVLLRSLPIAHPERLSYLEIGYTDREGHPTQDDYFDYPTARQYRAALADRADVLLIGGTYVREDTVLAPGAASERVYRQYVSGNVFGIFGLQPALGRLLTPNDDAAPGREPVAVLSYEFWTRRFARDPHILGKTFRMGEGADGLAGKHSAGRFEIVGVAPKGFTGTEPGRLTDVFIPSTMNLPGLDNPGWEWLRIWVRPKSGFSTEQIRQPLQAMLTHDLQRRTRSMHSDTPKQVVAVYLSRKVRLSPAAAGESRVQEEYGRPLMILGVLVALVLLLACANTGNLLAAQAAARAREMALRVSIGAGQWRLIQLVLVECLLVAAIASALGMLFASWAAPFVVPMLHMPGDPVRLALEIGWSDVAFSVVLAFSVTVLFGLAPALRASSVKPMRALRGGEYPLARRRSMNALLAAQMAFCVLVQFVAGLLVTTFERLSHRPLGFNARNVLVLDTSASAREQTPEVWAQVAERLRQTPGVESVAVAGWALLSENRWSRSVRVPGHPVEPRSPYGLNISPGYFATMRIALLSGRDFRPGDSDVRLVNGQAKAGAGIVNQAFARVYCDGQDPTGRTIEVRVGKDVSAPMEIIGYVADAAYATLREPMQPTLFTPLATDADMKAFLVRTAGDPLAMASTLRSEISLARSDFKAETVQAHTNFVDFHMLHERLLAVLSIFFAIVALVLAAIGLYGVLNYGVAQRRREIGIRMALGARSAQVVRGVTADGVAMIAIGAAVGVTAGLASGRFLETLLFEVKATDPESVAVPLLALAATALVAALPPALRAVRIDPAKTLRSE